MEFEQEFEEAETADDSTRTILLVGVWARLEAVLSWWQP